MKLRNIKKNETWMSHSSYVTKGEANKIAIRMEMLIERTTRVVYDPLIQRYWIQVLTKTDEEPINNKLFIAGEL